ncbi:MAG: isopentenyl phosphate kinase [Anaerolineae bacterium]
MPELVLLKLGGSVITDKNQPFTAREEAVRRLGRELREALGSRPDLQLILGHGSGSFGHVVAQKYHTRQGVVDGDQALRWQSWLGFAETAAAAARLNRLVTDLLLEEGVPVVSYQPSASARCRKGELMYFDAHPMKQVLAAGLVPMVYGDVAVDAAQGFTIISTEQIFDNIARELQPARIILAGVVDGVYDADPFQHPEASRYDEITLDNWEEVQIALGGSHGTDVTGGMFSKVRDMFHLVLAQPPLQVHIVSGETPGQVLSALLGSDRSIGTLIY